MSRYPKKWCVVRPVTWPTSPTEMSVTLLHEIEDCPLKWALEHADYPGIWDKHGYPTRIHLSSLLGIVSHSCIERIIRELVKAGCPSINSDGAVAVMRSLGGYTEIIRSCMDRVIISFQENPRAEHAVSSLRSSLQSYASDIRNKVRLLLGRLHLNNEKGTTNGPSTGASHVKQQAILVPAIYPEVELYARELHWRGRADLLRLHESSYELIDFKTGGYSEKHEFQMRVYALLWLKDSILNPTSRPINKLTLSYLREDVQVPVPSPDSLALFETEILERTQNCIKALSISPPRPKPDIEKCVFCGVRHLCEEYWQIKVGDSSTSRSKDRLIDVEITLIKQHGPLSWNVIVNAGFNFNVDMPALLRLPANHFLAHLAKPLDRLRVLDVGVVLNADQLSDSTIFTLNNISEAYSSRLQDKLKI